MKKLIAKASWVVGVVGFAAVAACSSAEPGEDSAVGESSDEVGGTCVSATNTELQQAFNLFNNQPVSLSLNYVDPGTGITYGGIGATFRRTAASYAPGSGSVTWATASPCPRGTLVQYTIQGGNCPQALRGRYLNLCNAIKAANKVIGADCTAYDSQYCDANGNLTGGGVGDPLCFIAGQWRQCASGGSGH